MTKTVDEIYGEMCAQYYAMTGIAVGENCDMAVRFYAAAAQLASLYIYGEWVRKQCFPQTAEGAQLDRHAEMRGLSRHDAISAVGELEFWIAASVDADMTIPEGTVCMSIAGAEFKTTRAGVIPAGSTTCRVPACAVQPGKAGNTAAMTVVLLTAPPVGIGGCRNPEAFTGGVDTESDASLRSRILASYSALPNGVNAAFYEKIVLDMDEVAAVRILPRSRGIGTVDVVVASADGIPSGTLLRRIAEQLEEMREIAVDINVLAPEPVPVDVRVSVAVSGQHAQADVLGRVRRVIAGYFSSALLGQNITRAELGRLIYDVEGVENYTISEPAADVSVKETELPVAGEIVIGSWN